MLVHVFLYWTRRKESKLYLKFTVLSLINQNIQYHITILNAITHSIRLCSLNHLNWFLFFLSFKMSTFLPQYIWHGMEVYMHISEFTCKAFARQWQHVNVESDMNKCGSMVLLFKYRKLNFYHIFHDKIFASCIFPPEKC